MGLVLAQWGAYHMIHGKDTELAASMLLQVQVLLREGRSAGRTDGAE